MNNLDSMVDDKTLEKLQALKSNLDKPQNNIEKKTKGAVSEIKRQLNLARNVEDNLSQDLKDNSTFNKEYKIIDNKRVIVFKRAQKAIEGLVPTQEDIDQGDKMLEEHIKNPLSSFIYRQLGEKNKTLLLDYLSEEDFIPNQGGVIKMLGTTEADFNAVYLSDNGCFLQIINRQEVSDPFSDENARFNIIAPDGSVVAENMNFQEGFDQFKDLAQIYRKDFSLNFEGDSLIEEMKAQEKSEISDVKRYNRSRKKLLGETSDIKNAPTALQPAIDKKTEENPFDAVFESEEQKLEREKDELLESLYQQPQDNNKKVDNHPFDALFETEEKKPDQEEVDVWESLYEKPKTPVDENDALLETLYQKAEVVAPLETTEATENKTIETSIENNPLPSKDTEDVLDKDVFAYAEHIGIKGGELKDYPDFIGLNPAQQKFVLEALHRTSLTKIKVQAHENFLAEKAQKKWYNLGFAFSQNFHKKKHEVLAAKNIKEQGLEGYGKTELSWLANVVKKGPEMLIDEDGDFFINYLKEGDKDDEERKELFTSFNNSASVLCDDPQNAAFIEFLNEKKEEILESAKDDKDAEDLAVRIARAEKDLKFHQFLKTNVNAEEIIQGLVDNSLGSWDKFAMMAGGQKDKLGYAGIGMAARTALRGEIATAVIGKSLAYAAGPLVAALVGGLRANRKAKTELAQEAELAKLGVDSNNKLIKSLNIASGTKEGGVRVGLADKLHNLINKYEDLKYKVARLEKGNVKSEEWKIAKAELYKMERRLDNRIEYTSAKMESDSISFGSPAERAMNYYKLLNALERANSIREVTFTYAMEKDVLDDNLIKDLESLNVENRLAAFLNLKEDKRHKAELKHLAIKTGAGAVMGASFATLGAWVFEHTGAGNWTSAQINHALSWAKGILSEENAQVEVAANIDKAVMEVQGQSAPETDVEVTEPVTVSEEISSTDEEIVTNNTETEVEKIIPTNQEASVDEVQETVVDSNPVERAGKPENFSDKISNENGKSDSVWKSTREIFKNNAVAMGYKGDLNDQSSLGLWAENQTAKAIGNSNDLTDKVFEGNKVLVSRDGESFKISVETGEGATPDYLSENNISEPVNTNPIRREIDLEITDNEADVNSLNESIPVNSNPVESVDPISETENVSEASKSVAKLFNLPSESLKQVGKDVIYAGKDGKIIFDTAHNSIKQVMDVNGKTIPNEFIEELKGRRSLEKFANRGGFDKVFSVWNKLSGEDKTVYESLSLFNQKKLTPFDLINKISGTFQVNATEVSVDLDNKNFLLNGKRGFEMNLEGVSKLVNVLKRRFS